jgi:hypothetical protein
MKNRGPRHNANRRRNKVHERRHDAVSEEVKSMGQDSIFTVAETKSAGEDTILLAKKENTTGLLRARKTEAEMTM